MNSPVAYCNSEIAPLKKLIVHRPDSGIGRITPRRAEELLFDDIVSLPKMQAEHDVFTAVLRTFCGSDGLLETQNLLAEALGSSEEEKRRFLRLILDYEEMPVSLIGELNELDDRSLARTLISGYMREREKYLFDPIPNFLFTRDIAVAVKDHVILTRAAKIARQRENWLTRFIFHLHPSLSPLHKEGKIINLNLVDVYPPSEEGEQVYIEGGDLMMIEKDYLLIGHSERTTPHAIRVLTEELFRLELIKHVVQVNIPSERSYMHIDTLFTQIDHKTLVCFKPIIYDGRTSSVSIHSADGNERGYPSVRDFFTSELGSDFNFIFCGQGKTPFQEREQWTDGCNLFAIRPGLALAYDRNFKTDEALEENGYSILPAVDYLGMVKEGMIEPAKLEKTIITLPSSELSRGRGGPHCMTCPLLRTQA